MLHSEAKSESLRRIRRDLVPFLAVQAQCNAAMSQNRAGPWSLEVFDGAFGLIRDGSIEAKISQFLKGKGYVVHIVKPGQGSGKGSLNWALPPPQ